MTEDIYERMIHFDDYFRNYAEANDYICQCLDSLQKAEDQIVQQNYAIQAMELLENTGFQDVRLQEIANQLTAKGIAIPAQSRDAGMAEIVKRYVRKILIGESGITVKIPEERVA